MNIRKQKRKEEEEKNKKREREVYNRLCIVGSFILLFGGFFGTSRGTDQSVFTILINNPSKGLPYVIIIVTITAIFYVIVRFFPSAKGK